MSSVGIERADGLAVLTIDNPPLNLFTVAVFDEIAAHLETLTADTPRALLIRGAGALTSGGVDVAALAAARVDDFTETAARYLHDIIDPLEALPCPTVAACHGLCLTAAFELALACDLIVASATAQFGLVEASLGLTPAMGGTARLAQRAGAGRARELVLTSGIYSAQTMLDWGVLARVYDDDRFIDSSNRFARRLADGPTLAHAATKAILRAWRDGGITAADTLSPSTAAALFDSADLRGGIDAFLTAGPGKATFSGR